LIRRGKIEKFGIFRGNFPNSNQRWLTQHRPVSKNFDQTRHYLTVSKNLNKFVTFCKQANNSRDLQNRKSKVKNLVSLKTICRKEAKSIWKLYLFPKRSFGPSLHFFAQTTEQSVFAFKWMPFPLAFFTQMFLESLLYWCCHGKA